ncbi:MAG: hypothetical protein A2Z72_01690 [Omnitrophica bacterium RBG_13_46_9]|nr:MAG: hypothetical protein A2Z72_01690 [Omnitrophica bacterium RBG_13_46_9]
MMRTGFLITEDRQKIAYNHYKNGNKKVVIIIHGFYNSKDSALLRNLSEELFKDYDVFIFDLRGHGQSTGAFTWTSRERSDLEAVLDYLKGKYSKMAIIAFSLGGSISINTLSRAEKQVDSLICISVPSDCSRIDYKWWRLDLENDIYYTLLTKEGRKGKGTRIGPFWLPKESPIDNMEKITAPTLFIHGDRDWVVDKRHSEALHKRTNTRKRLVIIENGPHAEYLIRKHPLKIFEEIKNWLKATI